MFKAQYDLPGSLFPSAHTSLSLLSLSLGICSVSVQRAAESSCALLNHRYVASLIFHASIAEITAQLLSLSMFSLFDFIRRRHDYKSGFLCRLKMGRVSVTTQKQ